MPKFTIGKKKGDNGYPVYEGEEHIGNVKRNESYGGGYACYSYFDWSDKFPNCHDECDYDNINEARKRLPAALAAEAEDKAGAV